jgi:hypothetical protein
MNITSSFVKALIILFAAVNIASAQEKVWLKLEKGEAVILDPMSAAWQPITEKTEAVRRTFLLTKERSAVNIFHATEMYPVGEEWYLFIEDIIPKTRSQVVAELTRIEAEQLPNSEQRSDSLGSIPAGLTYGKMKEPASVSKVPFLKQRMNTVNGSTAAGRNDAAVLTMKRMMAKYPSLYFDRAMVDRLFGLYEALELDGFLFDESSRLMGMTANADFSRQLSEWNTSAKNRLAQRRSK